MSIAIKIYCEQKQRNPRWTNIKIGNIFYCTIEGTCPYLLRAQATLSDVILFLVDSGFKLYAVSIGNGWRRSGAYLYRMRCPSCSLCIPLRLKPSGIKITDSLFRILKRNRDLDIIVLHSLFSEEHFRLWQRYCLWKHATNPKELSESLYRDFLQPWSLIIEYREHLTGTLYAVSHIDPMDDGLSSVYFSYLPEAKIAALDISQCLPSLIFVIIYN